MPVTLSEIRDASRTMAGHVVRTPCTHSTTLSSITGAEVYLKLENQQFTASFKERGASVRLLALSAEERRAGVIAMSAGNHAQAVAYHAERLGIGATIVMPRFTPNVKVERTRAFGAHTVLEGGSLEEAREVADRIAAERGYILIHPYDDPRIIAGQGTIALEMLEAEPDLDTLVIPIGGGGLIAGNAIAAKALAASIEIVGVQTERFPAVVQSLRGDAISCGTSTVAEGIAVKQPGSLTLPVIRELVDDVLLVSERSIEEAVLLMLEVELTLVEGAGAAALAALLQHPGRFAGRRVGLVVSGGNIDMLALSSIIQRGLVRTSRLVKLRVAVPDVPGALTEVTRLLGDANANIIEVLHQRAFTELSLRVADVEFVVQALGHEHIREILGVLAAAGFDATAPDVALPA